MFSVNLPRRLNGVSVLSPSPDHMLLAVGGVSGDVVVYNTQVEPWSPIRVAGGNGTVMHLSWAVDSSRLMAVRRQDQTVGSLHVWDVKGEPASKDVTSAFR